MKAFIDTIVGGLDRIFLDINWIEKYIPQVGIEPMPSGLRARCYTNKDIVRDDNYWYGAFL